MAIIELVADDFCDDGKCVKVGNVASAIAKRFLADGSPNKFQAEKDAWPLIHTGIVAGKLHVLDQVNRQPLSSDNSGDGMVLSNIAQYFPLISVQFFPLSRFFESDFCDA